MEAIAKFDFNASGEDELSFQVGDVLKILSSEQDWYKAELRSYEGYVPKNFVDLHTPIWFHEGVSRQQAVNILMDEVVGSFIVRVSQNSPGDFSISVRHEADVQHFKVMRDTKGSYFLWTEKFPSLNKLVEYYRTFSISRQTQIFLKDATQKKQQETCGWNTEKRAQEGIHLHGAAAKEVETSGDKRNEGHCSSWQHKQDKRGRSLDLQEEPHGQREHGEGNMLSMFRRHTDPTQQPQRTRWVRAMYDFEAEEHDELGFCTGDIVQVLDKSNAYWWKGSLRGKLGFFPANYVTPLT